MQRETSMAFPPAPWRLKGSAAIQLQVLSTVRARGLVPPELALVHIAPRKTIGGLFLATYGVGSTLEYHELIVIPALVRRGARIGAWISHIYVDEPPSMEGGRRIWALPKEIAAFDQTDDGSTTIRQGKTTLCVFHPAQTRGVTSMPVLTSVLSKRNGKVIWFRGNGTASLGTARGEVEVPKSSPFSGLDFGRGRRIVLNALDILLHAPRD